MPGKADRKRNRKPALAYCDEAGNLYDFTEIEPVFRTGKRFVRVDPEQLIEVPFGSSYFALPERYPVFFNKKNNDFNHIEVSPEGDEINAVSVHPSSGYLRTMLPAYLPAEDAAPLPMWAYTPLVFIGEKQFIPAVRIDDDPRSDPELHQDVDLLMKCINETTARFPENRLVKQLAKCSVDYGCLCARNFFIGRYEAPLPSSPSCNSQCAGCISSQDIGAGFAASHNRLDFSPYPEEIAEVMLFHFSRVKRPVASFGQGCEGEPLIRGDDLAKAVAAVRDKTSNGTININTNGSLPGAVKKMIDAGIDSIRFSLNSPTEKYYNAYHRPLNYKFNDLLLSIETALNSGIFVSLNLFFMPGFTDMESEVDSLAAFLDRFPVNMIQTRNLNIDPDFYFDLIDFKESDPMGIPGLLELLKKRKGLRLGYYNPSLE